MQNLNSLEFLAEAFQCHVHHFPPGLSSIKNGVHDTEKLLLKIQMSEDFA